MSNSMSTTMTAFPLQHAGTPVGTPDIDNLAINTIRTLSIDAGLLPAGLGHAAAGAYRELRRVQHSARLNEEPTQLPLSELIEQRQAVLRLWQQVLG